jgi:hypothetical protein
MDDMAYGDPVFPSAQLPLRSLLPQAPYIAYPVPSNWEFVQIVFCDAISWSAGAAFVMATPYMPVAEWLLNVQANRSAGGASATIGGWRGEKYGGNVVAIGLACRGRAFFHVAADRSEPKPDSKS